MSSKQLLVICLLLITSSIGAPVYGAAGPASEPYSAPFQYSDFRNRIRSLAWSPDGSMLAAGGDRGLWIYSSDLTEQEWITTREQVTALAWESNSEIKAINTFYGAIDIWQVSPPLLISRTPLQDYPMLDASEPSWSPNREMVLLVGYRSILIWNARTGEVISALSARVDSQITWSPDSRFIAIMPEVGASGGVQVWEIAKESRQQVLGDELSCGSPSWSPDGETVAAECTRGQEHAVLLWQVPRGELAAELLLGPGSGAYVFEIAWAPDSKCVAVSTNDGRVTIWDIATQEAITTLEGSFANEHATEIILWDAKLITTYSLFDQNIRTWDPQTFQQLSIRFLPPPG